MKFAPVNIKEVSSAYQCRFKPSAYMNRGRRAMIDIGRKGGLSGSIVDIVKNVYRPGIFKRIFISDLAHGKQYITASSMLSQDASMFSKILSTKMTDNIEPMILRPKQILVSCAGSIGDTRLIGNDLDGVVGSQDIIRVEPFDNNFGFVYAYLSCPTVYAYIQSLVYGSVVSRIEPEGVQGIPLIKINSETISSIHDAVNSSFVLRNEASQMLRDVSEKLYLYTGLEPLTSAEYDTFGPRAYGREVSCFSRNIKDIGTTSINAFNNSERIRSIQRRLLHGSRPIKELIEDGKTFSSGSLPSIEVKPGHGIMLINQKDIFDTIIKGKYISGKNANLDDLVKYGEILIASDGTLGENEIFCRTVFANEDLAGAFVSSHFLRMRSNGVVPAGYLYSWLNSDYGFRLIRNTQAGTKICHPIQKMFQNIPVPIIDKDKMDEIDLMVRTAFTKRHQANNLEKEAIQMVENEIDKWNNN